MTNNKAKKALLVLVIITEVLMMVLIGKLVLNKIHDESRLAKRQAANTAETGETTTSASSVTHEINTDIFSQTQPYVTTEDMPLVLDYELERSGFMLDTEIDRQEIKQYTVLVYMNGSNLESELGAASQDITEMLESGYDSSLMNILIFTGGTRSWQDYDIESEDCCIYYLDESGPVLLANVGDAGICRPETLTDFVNFGMELFPSQRCGLILWNHGGGAVEGFGYDEFDYDEVLTIDEIEEALENSSASKRKLEFFGFDACLMATLETAEALKNYVKYFIASEETEPQFGWDYSFLGEVTSEQDMTGDDIGNSIALSFYEFYKSMGSFYQTTISVMDLERVDETVAVLNNLSYSVGDDILNGEYDAVAKLRNKTKAFGTDYDAEYNSDMIDLVHLVEKLSSLYPEQCEDVIEAVDSLVLYNYVTGMTHANGVSIYFPYSSTESAVKRRVREYKDFEFAPTYKQLVMDFSSILTDGEPSEYEFQELSPVELPEGEIEIYFSNQQLNRISDIHFILWQQWEDEPDYYVSLGRNSDVSIEDSGRVSTSFEGVWKTIQNEWICLYEIETTDEYRKFSCPILLNGECCNMIIIFSDEYPDGEILGCSQPGDEQSNMAEKNLTELEKGDIVQFEYYAELFLPFDELENDTRPASKTFYSDEIRLLSDNPPIKDTNVNEGVYLYGFKVYDTQNQEHLTDFIRVDY